ncbi:MAG: 5-formyltetrahydrofolate cyclo-ligase [Herminiimonas sp.]|nr:5-formyltetrahydrofolate cyclo-ligase [Herminiimonas sp.]
MTVEPRIACESAATVVETAHSNAELKRRLRRRLLDARAAMQPAQSAFHDAAIAARLEAWLQHDPARLLGVYWPIRGEPDLRALYARLAAAGTRLALPVMNGPQSALQFAPWTPGEPLAFDRFGIATPVAAPTLVVPDTLLIPCVGVNASLHRLGYGGGFYDRTLALQPRPRAIGVCYEIGRTAFDNDAHDIPMDVVITESTPE